MPPTLHKIRQQYHNRTQKWWLWGGERSSLLVRLTEIRRPPYGGLSFSGCCVLNPLRLRLKPHLYSLGFNTYLFIQSSSASLCTRRTIGGPMMDPACELAGRRNISTTQPLDLRTA